MKKAAEKTKKPCSGLLTLEMLFFFLCFTMLGIQGFDTPVSEEGYVTFVLWKFKDGAWLAFALAFVVPVLLYLTVRLTPRFFPGDTLLLCLTGFLCALGILVLFRIDHSKGLTQIFHYLVGLAAMVLTAQGVRLIRGWLVPCILLMAVSAALLALPIVKGQEINGAKNWVSIGGFGFQPSEIVKLCLLIVLARLLSERRILWAVLYLGMTLGFLFLQKDLGTALIYFGVGLVLLYASCGSLLMVGGTLACGAGAAVFAVNKLSYVQSRITVWLDPWSDYYGKGYQVANALFAFVNGGLFGVGLGLGNAVSIPESHNDFIFPVILNEFGALFGAGVLAIFLFIVLKAVMLARRSSDGFLSLLALGCGGLLALQTFVIIGGNLKLIPLTGVTLPFISYGGTSLVSSLCVIGMVQGVAAANQMRIQQDRHMAMMAEEEK